MTRAALKLLGLVVVCAGLAALAVFFGVSPQ